MATKPFLQKTVPFSRLHLDSKNPRHELIQDEPLIIQHLLKNEQIVPLATDICERGLSPLERLAAIPHPTLRDHFVLVEGNRRLCSIKLLRDPAKAPTQYRKSFKKLADLQPSLPRTVEIAVFPNREMANQWVALKHGGQQGGVGTKSWTAAQTSRFKNSLSDIPRPNALALALLDYAVDGGIINTETRKEIPLTTLTRYISNPVVRSALGLTNRNDLLINTEKSEFDLALARFLEDVLSKKVHSRAKAAEIADYGRSLIASGHAPATNNLEPYSPSEAATPQPSDPAPSDDPTTSTAPPKRNNRSPDLGTKVVRTGYAIHISDHTTKRVFDELREIDASKYTFAAAALLRLLMERVGRSYARKNGIGGTGDLSAVFRRCAEHMEKNGKVPKSTFQIWRTLSNNPSHYLSPGTLGTYIHGGTTPVLSELRRGWTDLEAGLTFMLEDLG